MEKFLFVLTALVVLFGIEYRTAFVETYSSGKWKVEEGNVALTFDDCPGEPYTSLILDTLGKYDVRATFFIIGRRALENPEVVERITEENHLTGNHGYLEKTPSLFGKDSTWAGIIETQKIIKKITGSYPKLVRLPSGIPRRDIKNVLEERNLTPVFADVIILNEREKKKSILISEVLDKSSSGSIVLLHGDHPEIVSALPEIIKGLKKKGLNFVTLK